jgi:hypothetical protein
MSFSLVYAMFNLKNGFQGVVIERRHSFHRSVSLEVFMPFGTTSNEMRMKIANKFLNLGQMIVILAPAFSLPRLKQQITREHFMHHATKGPNICGFIVALTKDDLWGSVLSSLNLSRKVMMLPTSIS